MSVLNKLENITSDNFLILDIVHQISRARDLGKRIMLIWVKSHIGIMGNEIADKAANEAVVAPDFTHVYVTPSDLAINVKDIFLQRWQNFWMSSSVERGRRYFFLNPRAGSPSWFNDVISRRAFYSTLTRMRLGHGCFRAHLRRIGVLEDDKCDCDPSVICDLNHIVLSCARLERSEFERELEEKEIPRPTDVLSLLYSRDMDIYRSIYKFLATNNIHI